MDFSKWMLATSVLSFANRKADTFLIAKFLDASSLGAFALSRQIANIASAEIVAPIKRVLFPGYAKLAHDVDRLREAFVDAYGLLIVVALPVAIGIGLTADLFVPILLGSKWLQTIPLIQLLVISGGLRSLSSHARPVYMAMNKPKYGAYASLGRIVVLLPVLVFSLLKFGIEGAALAHAVAQMAVMFGSFYLMHRLVQLSFGDLWRTGWRALAGCALMIIAVVLIKNFDPVAGTGLVAQTGRLATAVLTGAIVYVGSILLLWRLCGAPAKSPEAYLLAYTGDLLRKRRARAASVASGNQS